MCGQPAMHLYITHAIYFEIYTQPLEEGIQLMSIARYEAFICVCFFLYKHYVQPSYGCSGMSVVARTFVYTAGEKIEYIKYKIKSTETRTKNILGCGCQKKRTDTRGVGISNTVHPRLSEPRLSGSSFIRTPKQTN